MNGISRCIRILAGPHRPNTTVPKPDLALVRGGFLGVNGK